MSALNAEIRAELGRQRMTYASLARATSQTRQAVQRKLTAERSVNLDDLEAYSKVLGIPAWKIVRSAQAEDGHYER